MCIGWGFTGVKLSTGNVGVCHSLLNEQTLRCCRIFKRAGKLAGSPAMEIAELAKSWDLSESVVGTATLNAMSQMILDERKYAIEEGTFLDYIKAKVKATNTVALISRMEPFIDFLKRKVKRLYVLERNPRLFDEQTLPDTACDETLPKADVVIITGSSIANKTIEHILSLSRNAREVGVVGPSAGLVPDPLFKRGVTILSGIKPLDADRLLEIIAEGGGTPQIKPVVKFINIKPSS